MRDDHEPENGLENIQSTASLITAVITFTERSYNNLQVLIYKIN